MKVILTTIMVAAVLVLLGSLAGSTQAQVPATLYTSDTYSGEINHVSVSGSSSGTLYVSTATSENSITFTSFPSDFNPMYGKSWKCKHHKVSTPGFPDLPSYDYEITLEYSNSASGSIHTYGTVVRVGSNGSSCSQTWEGSYAGPTADPTDLEFYEIIAPTEDPYVLSIEGYREMDAGSSQIVECTWSGTLTSEDEFGMTESYRIDYEWSNQSWNAGTGVMEKEVEMTFTEL